MGFRNTVIIMTSNIGSQHIIDVDDPGLMREKVKTALGNTFWPEFLNRVDEIVVFHRLDKGDLQQIAEIQLDKVLNMLADRDIQIELTNAAKELLVAEGYDPLYGARPLKRVIQKQIVDPIALRIIEGEVKAGDRIDIKNTGGEFVFSVKKIS